MESKVYELLHVHNLYLKSSQLEDTFLEYVSLFTFKCLI